MLSLSSHVVVAGAGSIGCFVGGLLAASGRSVSLLARPRVVEEITANGLHLSDFSGLDMALAPDRLRMATEPDVLRTADLVLVTVKTGATADIARQIAELAPRAAVVVSLQNGVQASALLQETLPERDIRPGMVPFNVVPQGPGHYHRATSGDILIGAGPTPLPVLSDVPHMAIETVPDITGVQWGKLLINLNNALNALSGQTVQAQLMDRAWRRLMADQMAEGLRVLSAAGLAPVSTTPVPASWVPTILRLPTALFRRVAAQMLTIDPEARTSMAYDLRAARPTEVDALQGEIIRLGQAHCVPTPICAAVQARVRAAEAASETAPALSAAELRP